MTQSKRHTKTGSSRARRRAMLLAWLVSSACVARLGNAADSPFEGEIGQHPDEKSSGAWVSSLPPLRAIGLRYANPIVHPLHPTNPSACNALPTHGVAEDSNSPASSLRPSPGLQEPPRLFAFNPGTAGAIPPLPTLRATPTAGFVGAAPNEVSHAVASQAPTGVILASGNAMPAEESKVSIRIGEPAKQDANRPVPVRTSDREHVVDTSHPTAKAPARIPQQIKPQAIRTQGASVGSSAKRSVSAIEPPANLNVTRVEGITEHSPVRLSFADDKVTAAPMPRSVNGYAVMRNGSEIPVAVRPIEPGSKVLQSVKASTPPLVSAIQPVSERDEAADASDGTATSDAVAALETSLASETPVAPEFASKPSMSVGFVAPSRSRESMPVARPAIVTPVESQPLASEARGSEASGAETREEVKSTGIAAHRPEPSIPPIWANPPVPQLPSAPAVVAIPERPAASQSSQDASRTKITLATGPSTATVRVRAVPDESIEPQFVANQSNSLNREPHTSGPPSEISAGREEQRRVPVLVGAAPPTLETDSLASPHREPTGMDAKDLEPDAPPAFKQEDPVDEALLQDTSASSRGQEMLQLRHADMTTESAVLLPKGPSLSSGPLESGVVPDAAPRLEVESHTANEFLVEGKITNIHIEDPSVCRVLASNGRVFLVGDRPGETVVAMRTAETIEPIYVRVAVVAAWRNPRLGVTDMEQLRATIANLAPQSNLRIQPQPDGSLWVSGMVDSNEQAKRIMELTRRLVLVPVVDKLEVR